MEDATLTTQAALLYPATPDLTFDELLTEINTFLTRRGEQALERSEMSSQHFVLFSNPRLHVSIALHATPLGARGLDQALTAAVTRAKGEDFDRLAADSPAHLRIAVGDGPHPMPIERPDAVQVRTKLRLLQEVLRLVTARARPLAAHLCTSDLFYTPEELAAALAAAPSPVLTLHPVPTPKQTGPRGRDGTGLIAWQSHHLIGRTLVLEGIPEAVPLEMSLALLDTLVREKVKGALALAEGDALKETLGMALYVRHAAPDATFPKGRIIVSFWPEPAEAAGTEAPAPFRPHPGYSAVTAVWERDAEGGESVTLGHGSLRSTGKRQAGGSGWMILVGIGLFLWVGLPLLNLPKMAIESAFSDEPVLGETSR